MRWAAAIRPFAVYAHDLYVQGQGPGQGQGQGQRQDARRAAVAARLWAWQADRL